jgi:hypothetical protein
MKVKPLICSDITVQAILAGRKTQTRRVVKARSYICDVEDSVPYEMTENDAQPIKCPYGKPGDILWVRETFAEYLGFPIYKTDNKYNGIVDGDLVKWKPSIFMPKEACRIFLQIKSVRVEKLQDISEEDASKEGCNLKWYSENAGQANLWPCPSCDGFQVHGAIGANWGVTEVDCIDCNTSVRMFKHLWESINKNWDKNPWVWVIEFERIEKPNNL